MVKRLWLTIILAVLVPGSGHMYLGFIKRGITFLIFAFILGFATTVLMPDPLGTLVMIGFLLWGIYDAYVHYKNLNIGKTQVTQ